MPHCKILAFRLKTTALCQEKIDLGPSNWILKYIYAYFLKHFNFGKMKLRVSFLPGTVYVGVYPRA